jgi:hypothetical protein
MLVVFYTILKNHASSLRLFAEQPGSSLRQNVWTGPGDWRVNDQKRIAAHSNANWWLAQKSARVRRARQSRNPPQRIG